MDNRFNGKVEEHVDGTQLGFRKGKRSGNTILILRIVIKRPIDKQKDLYMCLADFEKTFNTVRMRYWSQD